MQRLVGGSRWLSPYSSNHCSTVLHGRVRYGPAATPVTTTRMPAGNRRQEVRTKSHPVRYHAGRSRRTHMSAIPHSAKPSAAAELDPLDLYDVRGLLTEDERMVQDSVGRFVDEKVLPIIQRVLREASLPEGADPRDRRARVARLLDPGLRLRRPERRELRAHLPGARARRFGHPQLRLGAVSLCMYPDLRLRQRRAEAEVAAATWRSGEDRLLRPHRAARRLRSREHEDPREARRASDWVHQRREDVDHQRRHRRPVHLLGDDGRRHPRLHRREGHEGFRAPRDRAQVHPARVGHLGAVLRQRRRAGSEPAARA